MILNAKEIRENAPIYDIIKEYVDLKRSGTGYTACCPFHNEKTPSFHVNPSKNIFKCFGCGEGGDAIHFLMEHANMTYPEALKKAADVARMTVDYSNVEKSQEQILQEKEEREKVESLMILNKAVHQFYKEHGPELKFQSWTVDHEGKERVLFDLWGRTYTPDTIDKFGICITPDANKLTKDYKNAHLNHDSLLHLGLIAKTDRGQYDFFRNRLLFPIYHHDHRGNILAFSGRKSPDNTDKKIAKYKNSKESLVWNKSKALYGLYQNKKAISTAGTEGMAFLTEGYTDVLTMVDYGVENTVASCGTAFTIEQAKLLKRYAKEVVVLRDGDAAGLKAAKRDVMILVEVGVFPKVMIMPENEDPDSFLRKHGERAFRVLAEDSTRGIKDGILWRVEQELGDNRKDALNQSLGFKVAVKILSHLNSFQRDRYIRIFSQAKYFNCNKKSLEEAVLEQEVSRRKDYDQYDLSTVQERDLMRYGIFVGKSNKKKGEQFMKMVGNTPVPVCNFVIQPVYHIMDEGNPGRRVRIQNIHGHSVTMIIHTDLFEEFSKFRKAIAAKGNFKFSSTKDSDFVGITSKLYDEMPTVHQISTLGHHSAGFYTWGNGVVIDGKFFPCTNDGRINVDGNNFVIQGYDIEELEGNLGNKVKNVNEHFKKFRFFEGHTLTPGEWAGRLYGVYGENGLMGAAYYFASLYRDLIFPKMDNTFPHLNLFGPKGKGKSTLAWTLGSMFGKARRPMSYTNFTKGGFVTRNFQTRDGIFVIEEYNNEVGGRWKVELLKNAFDGFGRERQDISYGMGATENTPVLNGICLVGQYLPTLDIALLERCITLSFYQYDSSTQGEQRLNELKSIEKTGMLSQITSTLQKYRDLIDDEFDRAFSEAKSEVTMFLKNIGNNRIINNHVMPLAVVKVLSQKVDFPMIGTFPFYVKLQSVVIDLIKNQVQNVDSEDETSDFWRRFYTLANEYKIRHEIQFAIHEHMVIEFKERKNKTWVLVKKWERPNNETEDENGNYKKVIYIHLDGIHPLYEKDTKAAGRNALGLQALKIYLEQNPAYIGKKYYNYKKAKSSKISLVFDMDKLNFDMPVSTLATIAEKEEDSSDDK